MFNVGLSKWGTSYCISCRARIKQIEEDFKTRTKGGGGGRVTTVLGRAADYHAPRTSATAAITSTVIGGQFVPAACDLLNPEGLATGARPEGDIVGERDGDIDDHWVGERDGAPVGA